ncbi:hypothetical protein PpBr36_04183 [Pyricularia pennisetigena]|uniref:hypothetical protein n=1 Tax=Pyricularia pennisetigena TaxID=1578925 RepID=UPI0011508D21|nr:hypothetical protein PpBr36_04183 [Pyricularia pennisetigena]TLS27413.1 hypothetical protein PpBr36_04183 [Pyricularia pennisetigena]
MQFSMLKVAVAALAVCSDVVMSQATPAQVVTNIQTLTTKSQALQGPAQSINLSNAVQLLLGQGPMTQVITGLTDIISTATVFQAQMQSIAAPTETEIGNIVNAFRDLSRVQQTLLNTLTAKAGIMNTLPFIGAPMAAVLRQLENALDTLAFRLIDLVGSRATDLQSQASSLGQSLSTAIAAYSGNAGISKKRSLSRRDAFRAALRA